jgi:hypothetical protein
MFSKVIENSLGKFAGAGRGSSLSDYPAASRQLRSLASPIELSHLRQEQANHREHPDQGQEDDIPFNVLPTVIN